MIKIFLLPCVLLAGASAAFAQLEKIDTDRPDQTESPVLTPKKWIQFEMGFSRQQNNPSENEFMIPTLLTKYGISKRFDLRLITSIKRFPDQSIPGNNYTIGLEPVEIGTRMAISEERKWIPKTSVLFHLAIPWLASKKLKADKLAPSFRFSMQHSLSKIIGIGYNLGAEWDGFNDNPGWIYTFTTGYTLSEKFTGYLEVFGSLINGEEAQHNIDGGISYIINNNSKVDLSSGFGLTKDSPVWYLAIGASIRFKTGK